MATRDKWGALVDATAGDVCEGYSVYVRVQCMVCVGCARARKGSPSSVCATVSLPTVLGVWGALRGEAELLCTGAAKTEEVVILAEF
jgi:hypothetical protein